MKDHKLTDAQRSFAEQHYDVLERFLHERQLPFDEYYDVVVFVFLDSVKLYDECRYRETFEAVADRHMSIAVQRYRAMPKRCRLVYTYSLVEEVM